MRTKHLHGVKPVMVEWIDSSFTSGWGALSKPSDLRCVTVGNLVSKSIDRLTISLNASEPCTGHYMEIPLVAVTRIKHLK